MKRFFRLIQFTFVMLLYSVGIQAQTEYWLFKSATNDSQGNDNDVAVVGADLYKSVQNGKKWTPVASDASSSFQVATFTDNVRTDHENEVNANNYYKVPLAPYTYYQLALRWTPVEYSETQNCTFISNLDGWTESTINEDHINDGDENNCVKFPTGEYDYYVVTVQTDHSPSFPTVPSTDLTDDQKASAKELSSPPANGNLGGDNVYVVAPAYFYYKVPKCNYYKKKKIWLDPISELPDGVTATFSGWTVSDIENNTNQNAGYYAVASDYAYYYVENKYEWQKQDSYNEQKYNLIALYSSTSEMVDPTASDQYCAVGGETYTKTDGTWKSDVVETNWDETTGTLTIGTDETRSISEILAAEGVTDNDNVQKIVFADKSTWERKTAGGQLTATKNEDEHTSALKDAGFMVSYYESGTLTVGAGDETTANLPGVVQALSASDATRVELPDGAVWDKATGKLTAYPFSNATADQNALDAAGFTVSSVETVTNYPDVTITVDDNGVVTITSRRAGAAKELLTASDDEATAVKALLSATTSTKLVFAGPFNADDLAAVSSNDNDAVTSVNMSEATFENYSDMKFTYWSSTITNAVTSNYAPDDYYVGKTNGTFSGCSKLESVTYNSGIVDGVENNADDIKKFTTVVIGSNVKQIATKAFFNIASITTLNTTAADKLTVIGNSAFMGCTSFSGDGTGEFHIPNSVQTIEESAFQACYGLVNLYFDADSHISSIQKKAFYMTDEGATHLKNVYVNVNPAREVPCAKETFNKTDCCNQTAVGTARLRLHYPPKYYDFYVGEYKSQYNGGGITQSYLNDAYAAASNGWQEIMSSGILMPDGVNWRTFSDEVPYYVPESPATDGTVREIYLVHGYDAAKGAILVRMKVGDIIPKNTGVIVHYTFRSGEGGAALYLLPVLKDVRDEQGHYRKIVDPTADAMPAYDEAAKIPDDDKRYKPTDGTEYFKNYLKKLNKVTVYIDNVEIENGQKTYRNYFFCNNDEMKTTYAAYQGNEWSEECLNGWGFLRAVHGNYTISNKAYLHFPATEGFPGADLVGIQEDHGKDTNTSSAKLFGFTTIDENGFEFECAPVLQGIATSVKNVEPIVNDDSFYNMQGMKVENPSKGIYIKNGKKYVIK